MKFKIKVKNDRNEWWEEYDENTSDPQGWAENIVDWYNQTLRPGELPRELLEVELLSEQNTRHDWEKRTDGMSVNFRGRIADLMECKRCGVTGKKYGLSDSVILDSKFRRKVFQTCTPETKSAVTRYK